MPKKPDIPLAPENRLKELRAATSWTLTDVANFTNLSVSMVRSQELRQRRITKEQAEAYARLYQLSSPVEIFIGPPEYGFQKKKIERTS